MSSHIQLHKAKEAKIQSCFSSDLDFHYSKDKDQFEKFLEEFKLRSKNLSNDDTTSSNNSYEENIKKDRLIVKDNVSSLADTFHKFESFLTVARTFKYNDVYIFLIYPEQNKLKIDSFSN